MRRSKTRITFAALTLAVLALSACGDDKESAEATQSSSAPALTDPPVKVVFISLYGRTGISDNPENLASLKATVDSVNANGGVGPEHRRMEVYECRDKGDENEARKCATDAASDPDVLATVLQNSTFGKVINPILEQASVAAIGSYPLDPADYNSPIHFPFVSGGVGTAGPAAALLAEFADISKIQVVAFDGAQGPALAGLMDNVSKLRLGHGIAGTTFVPPTTTDMTPLVNEAATADGAMLVLTKDHALKFIQTERQLGIDKPIGTTLQGTPVSALKDLGDAGSNVYVLATQKVYSPDSTHPGHAEFDKVMNAFGEDVLRNDNSVNAFLAVKAVADLAGGLATIDRASFLEAWNATDNYDTGGITPPVDFTTPATVLGGAFPRMFNSTAVYYKWDEKNGELVQVSEDFVDPFQPK